MRQQIRGTGVALVTPFDSGKVDFDALTRIVNHVIEGGVDFLVALGTTGESVTLTDGEQTAVLKHIIEVNNRQLPVVTGQFGSNNTVELVERVRRFDIHGVDAVMSSSPAYNKPSQEGIFQHYAQLADASPLPIIIYNVPGRTSCNVEAETIVRLAQYSDKFIAVKEASADLLQCMSIIKHKPDSLSLLSGDDPTAFPTIAVGGQGVISVIANAFPSIFSNMTRAALASNMTEARRWNERVMDLHDGIYIDGNPAGIKAILAHLGLCKEELRLPLVPMTSLEREALLAKVRHQNPCF